jgi:hypothetical protein
MERTVRIFAILLSMAVAGCAASQLASSESDLEAKQFEAPAWNRTALYVYREDAQVMIWGIRVSFVGNAKTDLSMQLPNRTFIRFESEPGLADIACHTADLRDRHTLNMAGGQIRYYRAKVYLSTYTPYCLLETIEPEVAQAAIAKLKRAEIQ